MPIEDKVDEWIEELIVEAKDDWNKKYKAVQLAEKLAEKRIVAQASKDEGKGFLED
jgi:hypothetical protein